MLINFFMNTSLYLRYELVRPPDGLWGAEQPDSSWSGMMGMVHREVSGTVATGAVQTDVLL